MFLTKKTKFVSEKRLRNPWISSAVIKSIKTKNNLYKDYKIGAISEAYYKEYRNTKQIDQKSEDIPLHERIYKLQK